MGKFMDEIKKGTDANEALKKVTGTYGLIQEDILDVTFGHFQVTRTFGQSTVQCTYLATQTKSFRARQYSKH